MNAAFMANRYSRYTDCGHSVIKREHVHQSQFVLISRLNFVILLFTERSVTSEMNADNAYPTYSEEINVVFARPPGIEPENYSNRELFNRGQKQ